MYSNANVMPTNQGRRNRTTTSFTKWSLERTPARQQPRSRGKGLELVKGERARTQKI